MYSSTIEFIKELYPNQPYIPLHEPRFWGNEKNYVIECIESTFVSSIGKFVDRFEEMTASYTGAKKAVVCVNGTNGLYLALRLLGVDRNDEVITQPLSFVATCNAISYLGAHPVFVDVDRDTMGLSPSKLEEWLLANAEIRADSCFNKTTGRRIKACVPMHTFGHPVRIDQLVEMCEKYSIEVIEDAAESLGSFYKGRHTGTFSKIGVISYNGNKTITTGGGGMLLFNDEKLGELAKHLTTQAKMPHRWEFVHDQIGYNFRMPNINAALGCAQMEQLDFFLSKKRELALCYSEFFKNAGISFVHEPSNSKSNYWLNSVVMSSREERDKFLEVTNNSGVMTRPIWRLMSKLPMFEACQRGDLSNAEWLESRVVNIPSSVKI